MASINQTLIIRTDIFSLPDDMGLLAAQVAHIHFEHMRKLITNALELNHNNSNSLKEGVATLDFTGKTGAINEWLESPYLLVKRVPNAEALTFFKEKAVRECVTVNEWYDTVYVRLSPTMKQAFENVLVGISLGPADADKIRTIVGDLPLL